MKNNYSITERNRIVEEHLYCIDRIIRRNSPLMQPTWTMTMCTRTWPFG